MLICLWHTQVMYLSCLWLQPQLYKFVCSLHIVENIQFACRHSKHENVLMCNTNNQCCRVQMCSSRLVGSSQMCCGSMAASGCGAAAWRLCTDSTQCSKGGEHHPIPSHPRLFLLVSASYRNSDRSNSMFLALILLEDNQLCSSAVENDFAIMSYLCRKHFLGYLFPSSFMPFNIDRIISKIQYVHLEKNDFQKH